MNILKKLEKYNKWIILKLLKLFLRNKEENFPIEKNRISKILILRYDVLGDMIITIPMINYLKQNLPNSQIDILCSERNYLLAQNVPEIRKVFIYSGEKLFFKELKPLKNENYDLILSLVFNKTSLSGLIANYINKNSIKVNILESKRADLYSILFNILLPIEEFKGKITLLELQLKMISLLFGWDLKLKDVNKASLKIKSDYEHKAILFYDETKSKKVIYNISAGADYRQFSVEKNIELLRVLVNSYPEFNFYISYHLSDYQKANIIANAVNTKNCKLSLKTDNIMQLIALIKHSDYVITPDTSVVHIASMFDIPTIIFVSQLGPLPIEWAPFNNEYIQIITKDRTSIELLENEEIFTDISKFIKNN